MTLQHPKGAPDKTSELQGFRYERWIKEDVTKLSALCHVTGEDYGVLLTPAEVHARFYRGGSLPSRLSADEKEFLISKTSPKGWEKLYPPEDDIE